MRKWMKLALFGPVIALGGYSTYDAYRVGYYTRPEMPEGAFSLSFTSGLRAILVNVPDQKETRRYLGFPIEVPFYLKDAWSSCSPPKEDEGGHVSTFMNQRDWSGERFEAVCRIEVEGRDIVRGLITSVPKL